MIGPKCLSTKKSFKNPFFDPPMTDQHWLEKAIFKENKTEDDYKLIASFEDTIDEWERGRPTFHTRRVINPF